MKIYFIRQPFPGGYLYWSEEDGWTPLIEMATFFGEKFGDIHEPAEWVELSLKELLFASNLKLK